MQNKYEQLIQHSDPTRVKLNLNKYLGKLTDLYISNRNDKKYFVINPENNKKVHFGDIRYQDYTIHQNEARR